jgi:hypothetical protein
MYKLVNWYQEQLEQFYGDDNKGFIYGVYYYSDPDDFPDEVEWFISEQERAAAIEKLEG